MRTEKKGLGKAVPMCGMIQVQKTTIFLLTKYYPIISSVNGQYIPSILPYYPIE